MAQGDSELQDLYRDVLLDYYKETAHKGRLENAEVDSEGQNPVCGDNIHLTAGLCDGRLGPIRLEGHGCVISQASAAMMVEALDGKTIPQAEAFVGAFKNWMLGERDTLGEHEATLSEAAALEGVRKFPVRIKCALLAWNTLLEGIRTRKHTGEKVAHYTEK